jgi:hypothetical protein
MSRALGKVRNHDMLNPILEMIWIARDAVNSEFIEPFASRLRLSIK